MRAVSSVIDQGTNCSELLIIDDGSTDGSYELALELSKKYDAIQIFRRSTPGPGGYAARNLGIHRAKQEWVAFLDADDEWRSGFLDELKQVIKQFPQIGCVSSSYIIDEGNGFTRLGRYAQTMKGTGPHIVSAKKIIRSAAEGRWAMHTSSVAAKREQLLKIGGFPEQRCKRGGDRDTWLRLIMEVPYAWTPYIGAVYHTDSINMVTRHTRHPAEPCISQTIQELVANHNTNKKLYRELKRLYNASHKSYFRQKRRIGDLKISDIGRIYWRFDIKMIVYVMWQVFLSRFRKSS